MSSATSIRSMGKVRVKRESPPRQAPVRTDGPAGPGSAVDAGFRPWHFFVLASLMAATAAVVMSRQSTPEHLILISLTIGAAGLAAAGFYRMLAPLATDDPLVFSEPLTERKRILRMLIPPLGALKYVDHFDEDGLALMAHAAELGLEGIVGKKADSTYKAGRTPNWLKIRREQSADFVVVGFTAPKGSRGGFGAPDEGDKPPGRAR